VFAVPGNIGETYSEGCNKLIKTNKANLYSSVRDLEYMMNWSTEAPNNTSFKNIDSPINLDAFDYEEKKILKVLKEKNPIQVDELMWRTELSPGALAALLLGLEFKNVIESLPGKEYRLKWK
jgi:DNA processing protein